MKARICLIVLCVLLLCACATEPEPVPETPSPEPTLAPPVEDTIVVPTQPPQEVFQLPTPEPDPDTGATPEPLPPLTGFVIGLDPGHQAQEDHDTEPIAPDAEEQTEKCPAGTRGAVSDVYEYRVNLDVALKLKALLEANGAKVVMTRSADDVHLSNRERAEIFNRSEVDLAIRLHCNGTDDPSVRGAFMMVPTKSRTAYFAESVRAATAIIERYCAVTGLPVRKNKGVTYRSDQTGFNWCERPIVCIEMGYLSNEKEDLLLTNASFQDKMAFGILDGVLSYFNPEASGGGN